MESDPHMSSIDAASLFEAFGFTRQEGNGLWVFWKQYELDDEMNRLMREVDGVRSTLTLIEERADGRFFGYALEGSPEPTGELDVPEEATYYPSRDPRDMIALAFDGQTSALNNATGAEVDDGFVSGDWYVDRPFRTEDDLFDFTYTEGATGPLWRLRAPTVEWGQDYVQWRDELCERLLESSPTPAR
jgi:hypothetical protein